jgi:SAM-dependent methyltransferase
MLQEVRNLLAVPPDPYLKRERIEKRVQGLLDAVPAGERTLNIGAGFDRRVPGVINLDLCVRPTVDVICDAHQLPFADGSFSLALLRGLLEHVADPARVLAETRRVLRPGGHVYIEVPFLQVYHESPVDYRRFTRFGLERFAADFERVDSGVQIGPGSALAWLLREAGASVLSGGNAWVYRKLLALFGWATFSLKYLDLVVVDAPHVERSASAVYFLGRRR